MRGHGRGWREERKGVNDVNTVNIHQLYKINLKRRGIKTYVCAYPVSPCYMCPLPCYMQQDGCCKTIERRLHCVFVDL